MSDSPLPVMPTGPMMRAYDRERATKDKGYQRSPIGREVAAFLREMRYRGSPANTLDTYEVTLSRLARRFDDFNSLERLANAEGTEHLAIFLAAEWGDAADSTRSNR